MLSPLGIRYLDRVPRQLGRRALGAAVMVHLLLAWALACPATSWGASFGDPPPGEDGTMRLQEPAPAGPDDLVLPFLKTDEHRLGSEQDAAWIQLLRYGAEAHRVVIGRILTSRTAPNGSEVVSLQVERVLHGDDVDLLDFRIAQGDSLPDRASPPPPAIPSYDVLIYLDQDSNLLGGDAMYFVRGGCAWRNKRETTFFRPDADRIWVDNIDPRLQYYVFTMNEIEESAHVRRARRQLRAEAQRDRRRR